MKYEAMGGPLDGAEVEVADGAEAWLSPIRYYRHEYTVDDWARVWEVATEDNAVSVVAYRVMGGKLRHFKTRPV